MADLPIPHNLEAESALVGCALMDGSLASELNLEWFYDEERRTIAKAILDLHSASKPVDEITVRVRCGVHLTEAIEKCINAAPSAASWSYWKGMVVDIYRLREAWRVCGQYKAIIETVDTASADDEVRKVMDGLETAVLAIKRDQQSKVFNAKQCMDDMIAVLEKKALEPPIATGISNLDKVLRLRRKQMVVVAARPGCGKTALALRIMSLLAGDQRKPCAFVSMEMCREELTQRLVAIEARIPFLELEQLTEGSANIERAFKAMNTVARWPIHIIEHPGITMAEIASHVRNLKVREGVEVVFIDYLQLIRHKGGDKSQTGVERLTETTNAMKELAMSQDVLIIALSQLNREPAGESEPPRMHHLRGSGSIEQDGDTVVLLHRKGPQGPSWLVDALVEKQRNAGLGTANLIMDGPTMRFDSLSPIDASDIPVDSRPWP